MFKVNTDTVLLLISQYFVQTNLQLDNVDNLHY